MCDHVLDNRDVTVVDYLREHLDDADEFSIVSAYFSIYGYDLLASQLARVPKTRFLLATPHLWTISPLERRMRRPSA